MGRFSSSSFVGSSKESCQPRNVRVAFYTCGDGGRPNRRFGPFDPTEAYRQLATCLATDGFVFPPHSRRQAINDRTFNSIEAMGCISRMSPEVRIEKLYFIGHGTGEPSGYFFSGTPGSSREEFSSGLFQLFLLGRIQLGSIGPGSDYLSDLNSRRITPGLVTSLEGIGVRVDQPTISSLQTNRYWVVEDGEYRYVLRENITEDNSVTVIGEHTPYHEAHQNFIASIKRRLLPGAEVSFLCCFTGSGTGGGLIHSLYDRIAGNYIEQGVSDVSVSGYRDYFKMVIEPGSVNRGRISRFVLEIEDYNTHNIVARSRGSCSQNLPLPTFQVQFPVVNLNSPII